MPVKIRINIPVTSLYGAFIAATFGGALHFHQRNVEKINIDAIIQEGAHLELNNRLMAIKWEANKEFLETGTRNEALDSLIKNSELAKHGTFTGIPNGTDVETTDRICQYLHDKETAAQEYLKAASPEEIERLIENPEKLRIAANDDTPAEKALCKGISP